MSEIKTPWGPIGYVTYKRTYARKMKGNITEEFPDTVERELQGIDKQLKLKFTEQEKDFYGNIIRPLESITRKPITASEAELVRNPRSRSAKLRVAELVTNS